MLHIQKSKLRSVQILASFPGPAQFSIAYSTVLQAMESWAGPGNKAIQIRATNLILEAKTPHFLKVVYAPVICEPIMYMSYVHGRLASLPGPFEKSGWEQG